MTQFSSNQQIYEVTAGLDLGDKYNHLCLVETATGEILEEARLRTDPETLKRRFAENEPMRIAIETGTHSPWVSRLLENTGHEVLVANARELGFIYKNSRKNDRLDAENLARVARFDPKLLSPIEQSALRQRVPWRSSAGRPGVVAYPRCSSEVAHAVD